MYIITNSNKVIIAITSTKNLAGLEISKKLQVMSSKQAKDELFHVIQFLYSNEQEFNGKIYNVKEIESL